MRVCVRLALTRGGLASLDLVRKNGCGKAGEIPRMFGSNVCGFIMDNVGINTYIYIYILHYHFGIFG